MSEEIKPSIGEWIEVTVCSFCLESGRSLEVVNSSNQTKCRSCKKDTRGTIVKVSVCPFCYNLITKFDTECRSCRKPLKGEEYLRALLKHYKNSKAKNNEKIIQLFNKEGKVDRDRLLRLVEELSQEEEILKELKDALSREGPVLKINDPVLRKELQKIREEETSREDIDFDEEDEVDIFGWLDPKDIIYREREFGALIVGQSTSSIFHHCVNEIRKCYIHGLFNATVVFCRALLEVGLREALKKRGLYKTNEKVIYLDERNLEGLLRECKDNKVLPRKFLEKAHSVRKKANSIIHPKDKPIKYSEEEALSTIKDTLSILEELYR